MTVQKFVAGAAILMAASISMAQGNRGADRDQPVRERRAVLAPVDRPPPGEHEVREFRLSGPRGMADREQARREIEIEVRRGDGERPRIMIERRERAGGREGARTGVEREAQRRQEVRIERRNIRRLEGGRGEGRAMVLRGERMDRARIERREVERRQPGQRGMGRESAPQHDRGGFERGDRPQQQRRMMIRRHREMHGQMHGQMHGPMHGRGMNDRGQRSQQCAPMMRQFEQQHGPRQGPGMHGPHGPQQFGPRGPMMGPRGPHSETRGGPASGMMRRDGGFGGPSGPQGFDRLPRPGPRGMEGPMPPRQRRAPQDQPGPRQHGRWL